MENKWLTSLKKANKTCIVHGNLKKVHYAFEDGKEMVEEYNTDTNVLTRRAWKIKSELGAAGKWDIEIGDPEPQALTSDNEFIKVNSNQPFITRRVTKTALEWRIRNLPYPENVFSVTADGDNNCMIVRTTNKKYYKKIAIPDLARVEVIPDQKHISFTHKFNTLIITYKKPQELLSIEKEIWNMVKEIVPQKSHANPDDCRQT